MPQSSRAIVTLPASFSQRASSAGAPDWNARQVEAVAASRSAHFRRTDLHISVAFVYSLCRRWSVAETAIDEVHELQGEVIHSITHFFETMPEVIIGNGSRNGSEEPDGGCYQCFGDARPNRSQA